MFIRFFLPLLPLAGCVPAASDAPEGKDVALDTVIADTSDTAASGGDTSDGHTADTDTAETPSEACNGVDDNGDGVVDEGFSDADEDGRADCVDVTCPSPGPGDTSTVAVRGCAVAPVVDPWAARVSWDFDHPTASPDGQSNYSTSVVASLDDDDGDGDVDADDIPDLVTGIFEWAGPAALTVIDGATGTETWSNDDLDMYMAIAVGDLDGDGEPEIVARDGSGVARAYTGGGTCLWTSEPGQTSANTLPIQIADLDGDGWPEIIDVRRTLDGRTGAEVAVFDIAPEWSAGTTAVADVDLDGRQEVFAGAGLYDAAGALLWDTSERFSGRYTFVLALQADADPEAEIAFLNEDVSIWEHDGTLLRRFAFADADEHPGAPCLGDFDGDGASELVVPQQTRISLYELDGTVVWSVESSDRSTAAGCSGYDLDADGALEVLYADEVAFRILDGRRGTERYTATDHRSYTSIETPVPADLDLDGDVEIVVAMSDSEARGRPAIRVYEHDGAGWPASTRAWPAWGWALTDVGEDGAIPVAPTPWLTENTLRAGRPADVLLLPDLLPAITAVCVADCSYGPVSVAYQVENVGAVPVAAGVPVVLYANDGGVTRSVATSTLPAIPSGTRTEVLTFEVGIADLGTDGFHLAVDDDGTPRGIAEECVEDDNTAIWTDVICP
ncbi:MAG: FG-GAP-like repeat-containing protein [Pseudomonadota bacterium]|nr:FG-GAP-like repeat-containing protein [Pseudomonadota bacterium]